MLYFVVVVLIIIAVHYKYLNSTSRILIGSKPYLMPGLANLAKSNSFALNVPRFEPSKGGKSTKAQR